MAPERVSFRVSCANALTVFRREGIVADVAFGKKMSAPYAGIRGHTDLVQLTDALRDFLIRRST